MSDYDDSNDWNLARLGNRQLAGVSAKLVRRGLQSLDAAKTTEAGMEHKLPDVSAEEIPLPPTIKNGLFDIARSFLEEGRTDFDELVEEFENLLGPELFDEVADYLPTIIATEEQALEDRRLGLERTSLPIQPTSQPRAASVESAKGDADVWGNNCQTLKLILLAKPRS